jgi:ABC-type transporter Mla MlaB component
MLRITPVRERGTTPTLKLEGKLLEPWLGELLRVCDDESSRFAGLRLDMSAVTFVDAAGAVLLRELLHRGIQISACSGYVAELLHVEKR